MAQARAHERGRLVGRRAELRAVERAVVDLDAGRSRCLTIVGEPGIGKTRLADELDRIAGDGDRLVLRGRASGYETDLPFGVLVDALGPQVGELDLARLSPERATELAFVFPSLLGSVAKPVPTLQVERYRLHHAVRAAIEELARRTRLVLVLDDLHWADEASVELVAHLLHHSPAGPVLLVLLYREGQASRPMMTALATAEREHRIERLELAPLSADAARELIGAQVDARRREALIRASGGNPFYLEELAREAVVGETTLPLSVREAIGDELAALEASSRALLRAGAVAGDPFDLDLAAGVAGLSEDQALEALDELLVRDLVRARGLARTYRFRHPIVREAVYESIDLAGRRTAHSRAAAALGRQGAPAAARASHVEQSARSGDEDAIALLTEAAGASAARAPAAAARWYAAALRLLPDGADSGRRLSLLLPLGAALASMGRISESRDVVVEALDLVPEELADLRARVLVQIVRAEHMLAGPAQARRPLLEALDRRPSARSAALLRLEMGVWHWQAGEPEELRACAEPASRDAALSGDAVLQAEAEAMLALAERSRWNAVRATLHVDRAERLLVGASKAEHAWRLEGLMLLGVANHEVERFERAVEHMEQALQIARATGQNNFFVPLMVSLGITYVYMGRLNEAVDCGEAAVEAALLIGDDLPLMWALGLRCWTATVKGLPSVASEASAAAAAVVERIPDAAYAPLAGCICGLLRVEEGDPEGGRREILEHAGGPDLSGVDPGWRVYWYAALTDAELALGRPDDAEQWVSAAEQCAARLDLGGRRSLARRSRAALVVARGDHAAGAKIALAAAEGFRSASQPVEAARADLLAGRALGRAGERDRALPVLERALAACVRWGAERDRDAAERELRRLGRRRGGEAAGDPTGVRALSPRELEVASLVVSGLTNRRVAERLRLSQKTVESHLSSVYAKLGVASRTSLARTLRPGA